MKSAAAAALLLLLGPSATHADTKPPALTPIKAVFVQKAFATTYTATAKDADGDKLTQTWTLAPPAKDPKCNAFKQQSATSAVWQHGDFNHCNHAVQGPRGHTGTVTFNVTDGTWTCTETYAGTLTGNGGAATCVQAKPSGYTCSGAQVKLFDNSNGYGVSNGGKPPSFSTGGKAYCVNSITTYHWNNALGAKPGTIGLGTTGGTLGPYKATGSAGQNNAQNVNWTANIPTAPKPVVIKGTYTCVDSNPATWSQDQQSGGKGFCIVYATAAIGSGPVTTPTARKPKPPPPTTTPTTPKPKCTKGKLAIKAAPDTGKPPLAVTFALCSPKVVQWRVDFGDGKSTVKTGQPPATITHTYTRMGDYKARLSVLDAAGKASSKTANVSVAMQPLMSLKAQPASGNPPLKVTFTLGTTVQHITTWVLAFGDGTRSSGGGKPPASVSHTYTKAGSYTAIFSVKPGVYAAVSTFAQVTVGGGTPPTLSLTASPTSGTAPLKVTFTLGTNIPGTVVSWVLVFGDGFRQQGTGKPPATVSHTYTKKGTYAAFLSVAQQQQYGGVQYTVPRGGLVINVK
ncbi:MAG: PKD domain-containing protein [Gaiellaceae bacterium]